MRFFVWRAFEPCDSCGENEPTEYLFFFRLKNEREFQKRTRRWILIVLEWIIWEMMQTFRENPSQEILIACDLPQFPFLFSPRDLISLLCESSNGSCCKETKNAEHSCRNVRRSSAARAIREELQQTFLSILLLLVRFHRFRTHLDFFHTRSQRNLGWGNWKAIELVLFLNMAMLRWAFLQRFISSGERMLFEQLMNGALRVLAALSLKENEKRDRWSDCDWNKSAETIHSKDFCLDTLRVPLKCQCTSSFTNSCAVDRQQKQPSAE